MLWLFLAITAYAFFAIVAIGDKYLLSGRLPHPLVYAFYVGGLGGLTVLLAPFFGFPFLGGTDRSLALVSGAVFIVGLLLYYVGLLRHEASRIVPAIGGLLPLFTLSVSYFLFPGSTLSPLDFLAFVLLVTGSIAVTAKDAESIFGESFGIALAAAILLAFSFALGKYVYLRESFWGSFLWMRLGGAAFALILFLVSGTLRREIRKEVRPARAGGAAKRIRTSFLFLGNQAMGALATVLQSFAIYAAPPVAVALVNALEGTKYLFLIFFAALISFEFPQILHESFSRKSLAEKVIAVGLLSAGTAILIFSRAS